MGYGVEGGWGAHARAAQAGDHSGSLWGCESPAVSHVREALKSTADSLSRVTVPAIWGSPQQWMLPVLTLTHQDTLGGWQLLPAAALRVCPGTPRPHQPVSETQERLWMLTAGSAKSCYRSFFLVWRFFVLNVLKNCFQVWLKHLFPCSPSQGDSLPVCLVWAYSHRGGLGQRGVETRPRAASVWWVPWPSSLLMYTELSFGATHTGFTVY